MSAQIIAALMLLPAYAGPNIAADSTPIACGPRALSLAARLQGREIPQHALAAAFDGRLDGTHSLEQIADAAARLGLFCHAVRLDRRAAPKGGLPIIAPVRRFPSSTTPDHFVIVYGRRGGAVQVLDFPGPPRFIPMETFASRWNGDALYVASDPGELKALPSVNPAWAGTCVLLASAISLAGGCGFCRSLKRRCSSGGPT